MRKVAIAAVCAVLTGCGGGGGGGGSSGDGGTAPITSVNVDAAIGSVLSRGLQVNGLSTTDAAGVHYTLNVSITPGADAPFFGSTQKRSVETLTISRDGAVVSTSTSQIFFSQAPTKLIGTVDGSGLFSLFQPPMFALPTAAAINTSGPVATVAVFPSMSVATQIAGGSATWSTAPADASSALACINIAVSSTTSLCARVNSSDQVIGAQVSATAGTTTLTFR